MKFNAEDFFAYVSIVLSFSLLIGLISGFIVIDEHFAFKKSFSGVSDPVVCNGLDFDDSVACLHSVVVNNYNYVHSDDSVVLSDSELFARGGDCLDYSRFYKSHFDSNNLTSTIVTFSTGVNKGHAIVIASMSDKYCVLDQKNLECYGIK